MHANDLKKAPAQSGSPRRMFLVMTAIGLCSAALIVAIVNITRPFIEANRNAALGSAVFAVLPGAESKRAVFLTTEPAESATGEQTRSAGRARQVVYAGYNRDGDLVGVAIEARGAGFQDTIRLLYGYAPDRRRVIGVFVLESRETPGLGDRIEFDRRFLQNFSDLSIDNIQFVKAGRSSRPKRNDAHTRELSAIREPNGAHIATGGSQKANEFSGEIEGISGATISSRAVARIVTTSIETMAPVIATQPSGAFAFKRGSRATATPSTNSKNSKNANGARKH